MLLTVRENFASSPEHKHPARRLCDAAGRPAFALRLLADGSVLVADSAAIYLLNSAGNVVKTYDDAGNNNWFALNLDANGTSFWSGDSGTVNS